MTLNIIYLLFRQHFWPTNLLGCFRWKKSSNLTSHHFPTLVHCIAIWFVFPKLHQSWLLITNNYGIAIFSDHFCNSFQKILIYLFIHFNCAGSELWYIGSLIFFVACKLLVVAMWDLVPWPGIQPGPPALGTQSLSPLDQQGNPTFQLLILPGLSLVRDIAMRSTFSPSTTPFFHFPKAHICGPLIPIWDHTDDGLFPSPL